MKSWIILLLVATYLPGQPANLRLPVESAGLDGIVRSLIAAFDHVDIIALGEAHDRKVDSDLRIALVRHPGFAKKVRSIVVEFASTSQQSILDRYIRGEDVPRAVGAGGSPLYADFFAAVRAVNSSLPAAERVRVFGAEPEPGKSRESGAVAFLQEQVLQKRGKALVIYGAAHFYRAVPSDHLASMGDDIGIVRQLEKEYPGRTLAVIPVGGVSSPLPAGSAKGMDPDFRKFDIALKTRERPVLLSLQGSPLRVLTAEEFLGRTLTTCRPPGGCRSVFKGSALTLGEVADVLVYVGGGLATPR